MDQNSPFASVPYEVQQDMIKLLHQDGSWKSVALAMNSIGYVDIKFSSAEIADLERKESPANSLLGLFIERNLLIVDVQVVLWRCKLFNTLNKLITNERVKYGAPADDITDVVLLGQSYKLEVVVFGSPYPELQWYFNGRALDDCTSDELLIHQFSYSDVGEYMCQAKQIIDGVEEKYQSHKFVLTLGKSKPTIILGRDLHDIRLNTGEELALNIEALAEPQPTYIWYHNGKEITRSLHPVYTIVNIGIQDEGKYLCEVVNELGSCHSKEITVEVIPPCFAPDKPTVNTVPHVHSSYSFGDKVVMSFKVHCRHKIAFECIISGKQLFELEKRPATYSSETSENDFYTFNLHYEVNKDDWIRGDEGPIVIVFKAMALGSNESCVSTSVEINVLPDYKLKQFLARNKFALLIGNEAYPENADHLLSPVQDIQALTTKLVSLNFRCMTCRNLTKSQFHDILELFSSYLQPGDYVMFYYAGHGFHNEGVDYMIPIDAKYKFGELLEYSCVATPEVINRFQDHDPALIFSIYDMCRKQPTVSKDPDLCIPHKVAKANAYTIYATSEHYSTFEVQHGMSVVIDDLIKLIDKPISVQDLGNQFLIAFNHQVVEDDIYGPQIPRIDNDLGDSRSLADPWTPQEEDHNTVLREWDRMSNVGGTKLRKISTDGPVLEIRAKFAQEGYPMVISNCIDVVVNIFLDGKPDDTKALQKEKLKVIMQLNTVKITKDVTGDEIRCQLPNVQALYDDVLLRLVFKKKEEIVGTCELNLERPSLSNIRSAIRNDLTKIDGAHGNSYHH